MSDGKAICIPKIGVLAAAWVRTSADAGADVYFEMWPRYAGGLARRLRVPERALLIGYSAIAGRQLQQVSSATASSASARLRLAAMRLVGRIMLRLWEEIESEGWTAALGAALGRGEATAYFVRRFSWDDVWQKARAIALVLDASDRTELAAMWSPLWPDAWVEVAAAELEQEFGVKLLRVPALHSLSLRRLANFFWVAAAVTASVARLVRHGCGRARRRRATTATEFIDARRFGQGPSDGNFAEADDRIGRGDLAYFLTPAQARHLARHGWDVEAGLESTLRAGFEVIDLRRSRYSLRSLSLIARLMLGVLRRPRQLGASCLGPTFLRACDDVTTLLLLFDELAPLNVLHTYAPNGEADLRFDSAVMTGLARKFGHRSVGYQTRTTYDSVFEDAFDCYDVYLAWGEGWRKVLPAESQQISQVIPIGCIDNDGRPAAPPRRRTPIRVSVFTSELRGSYQSKDDVVTLLLTSARLARRFPDCRFQVKTKDPEHIDELLKDRSLAEECADAGDNFEFLRLARGEVGDLISASDIVIASAWTTPGTVALLLEKRAIYFAPLGYDRTPLGAFPNLIADSPSSLEHLFAAAVDDYDSYGRNHRDALSRLDPFRDGHARARMVDLLLDGAPTRQRGTTE